MVYIYDQIITPTKTDERLDIISSLRTASSLALLIRVTVFLQIAQN